MEINILQVDAFTDLSFTGNPAGVVMYCKNLKEEEMQMIANEMNLSETIFINQISRNEFESRFFTPVCEVDLSGHSTIGAFFALAKHRYIRPLEEGVLKVYQKTKLGSYPIELIYKDYEVNKVYMTMPGIEDLGEAKELDLLAKALRLDPKNFLIEGELGPRIISAGLKDIVIGVRSKEALKSIELNEKLLREISEINGAKGVHVFYLEGRGSDYVYTRNFSPTIGIYEEAATGNASGGLLYYLKKFNLIEGNKIIAKQGEALGRPSQIYLEIDQEGEVKVGGKAKIVIDAILRL